MVIVEVSQDVALRRLLDAHRWAEILQDPPHPEDRDKISSILRCKKTSSTHWRRIRSLIPCDFTLTYDRRSAIAHPYPPSGFCLPLGRNRTKMPSHTWYGFALLASRGNCRSPESTSACPLSSSQAFRTPICATWE
ncbi:hypothetical protein C8Q80DRAFT_1152166 [Daedaleopsis nitida]|nr:hypothetical protein C8Q80DRAFT_1152166 [Daedaleopsis nitida]